MTQSALRGRMALIAGLAAVYFITGKLGLALAFANPSATAIWLPTGITLASFLLLGYRVWPGIFLGAFLVNLTTAGSVGTSLGIAMGNTLEGLTGAYLVNRFANGRDALNRPLDIIKFTILSGMVSTAISATVGVTSLSLGGFANWADYRSIWLTWWLGNAAGGLIVAPLLLLWSATWHVKRRWAHVLEVIFLVLLTIFIGQIVFGGLFHPESKNYPLGFLYSPLLIWVAYRLGQPEAATMNFIFSGIAIWGTLHDFGPFVGKTQNESLLLVQTFLAISSVISMILASAIFQRKQLEEKLYQASGELEMRVENRTKKLQTTNALLAIEIKERIRIEKTLQENEEKFRAVTETANDAIVSSNENGHITYFNPAAERIFGYAAYDIIGKLVTLLAPKKFHNVRQQVFARFLRKETAYLIGRTVELTGQRKDGTEVLLELSLAKRKVDNNTFFTGILRDITDRKLREKDLRVSEERFRLMVEGVLDYAIFMLNTGGHIVSWNAGARRLKGYKSEEIIGKHFSCFYFSEDIQSGKPQHGLKVAEAEGRYEDQGWRMRRDGTRFWANVIITAMRDETGVLLGFIKVTRDLTERKMTEEAQHRDHQILLALTTEVNAGKKRLEVLSENLMKKNEDDRRAIARDLHDDIGQGLTALKIYLQTTQRKGEAAAKNISSQRKSVLIIVDQLMQRVRDLSLNLRPSLLDDLGLVETLRWWIEHQNLQKGADLKLTADTFNPRLPLDLATACFRIVQEAVNNALKHARAQRISIDVHRKDERLDLIIKDDGAGFDVSEALANTVRGKSMGLIGMEERVRALNGSFTIKSEPGRGTEVHANFPLSEGANKP